MNDSERYCTRKWLRPKLVQYIPRPKGSVLSAQDILHPSDHYPVPDHNLELRPCPTECLICHERFGELLCQGNGCFPITYGAFQDPKGVLSAQEILDQSIHYPVLDHHLELRPCPTEGQICYERFIELLCQENGCVRITYSIFQDPQGLSYAHKKSCLLRS